MAPKSAVSVRSRGSAASNNRARRDSVESGDACRPTDCASRCWTARGAAHTAARAVSAAPPPQRRLTRSRLTQQVYGPAYSLQGEGEVRMIRVTILALLAVLPVAAAAQRGDWPMPAKDYAATRYSDLSEITGANAGRLRPVWSFSTGVLGGHEGQPLVVDQTMYVVTPYPNVLYAFDLTREGYPLKWKYRPPVDPNALGIACCDAINRGAFYADGKILYNLLDGHTVAVAAATGEELWKTKIADLSQGETTPVAPLVVKHRVIVGASGGEFGIHELARRRVEERRCAGVGMDVLRRRPRPALLRHRQSGAVQPRAARRR